MGDIVYMDDYREHLDHLIVTGVSGFDYAIPVVLLEAIAYGEMEVSELPNFNDFAPAIFALLLSYCI